MLKPLPKAPKRLQSLLLHTQKFNYELFYKLGKSIPVADALSRATLQDKQPTMIETVDNLSFLPINGSRLDEIRAASDRDDTMSQLKRVIVKGWPEHKAELPAALTPFYDYTDRSHDQCHV